MRNTISIIIPIVNEAKLIGTLLDYLTQHSHIHNIAEIIVVDGGSNDASKTIVANKIKTSNKYSIKLLESQKGRAKQMNLGAKTATGTILYFLHADSFPPRFFCEHIISEIKKENDAGCFKMKFNSNHWWLKLASWLTHFSWRACRGGDQSQFITKLLFNELGGFNERFVIYEDNDLINRLYAIKKFVVIQHWLTTSARRYHKNGIWKLQYHFFIIYIKKWLGASAETLHKYYIKNIS